MPDPSDPVPDVDPAASQLLVDMGLSLTFAEAEQWLRCAHHRGSARRFVLWTTPWIEAGVPAERALLWWTSGFHPSRAADAAVRGWTPRTYRALMLMESTDSSFRDAHPHLSHGEVIDAWVTTGIDHIRVLMYREKGVWPETAALIEAKRLNGEVDDRTIETMLALRPSPVGRRWRPWLDVDTPDDS